MKTLVTIFLLVAFAPALPAQTILPADIQIKTAVLAAPSDKRDGSKVYGYAPDGKFIVLREGTNDMICLADNPRQRGILVSCYYYKLEPFMARGRELLADGKSFKEKFDTREEEVKAGKLKMPEEPSILFVVQGQEDQYTAATGELKNAHMRYVIYIPYATTESTGLPLKPDLPGMPWLMDAGTHRAHIMITPPLPGADGANSMSHPHK